MNSLTHTIYNPPYSYVYVEREAFSYPLAGKILSALTKRGSQVVAVAHYMDLFGRTHQSFPAQKNAPALILAVKHGNFLYPGAPVCQNFGNAHFYYTSFAMNCPFDCEYCYLQGMYASANVVVFVNQDDYFAELAQLLTEHPVYLCISYDTDLLALEHLTGFLRRYISFAAEYETLTTEIRTKSAVPVSGLANGLSCGKEREPADLFRRMIMAYTLSPESIIARFEHHTPPLAARRSAIRAAHEAGFGIRLCFDPLLAVPDFKTVYGEFLVQVREALRAVAVQDASIGVFRISDGYLKQMRRNRPGSALLQYPFTNENHVCSYGARGREMVSFVKEGLAGFLAEDQIFTL